MCHPFDTRISTHLEGLIRGGGVDTLGTSGSGGLGGDDRGGVSHD